VTFGHQTSPPGSSFAGVSRHKQRPSARAKQRECSGWCSSSPTARRKRDWRSRSRRRTRSSACRRPPVLRNSWRGRTPCTHTFGCGRCSRRAWVADETRPCRTAARCSRGARHTRSSRAPNRGKAAALRVPGWDESRGRVTRPVHGTAGRESLAASTRVRSGTFAACARGVATCFRKWALGFVPVIARTCSGRKDA